jgi:transposase InsO family protein
MTQLELAIAVGVNAAVIHSLAEAQAGIEAWRRDYNESRSHMGLSHRTPQEYLLLASTAS